MRFAIAALACAALWGQSASASGEGYVVLKCPPTTGTALTCFSADGTIYKCKQAVTGAVWCGTEVPAVRCKVVDGAHAVACPI